MSSICLQAPHSLVSWIGLCWPSCPSCPLRFSSPDSLFAIFQNSDTISSRKPSLSAHWLHPLLPRPHAPGQMGVTPIGLVEQQQGIPHRASLWLAIHRRYPLCSPWDPYPTLPHPHGIGPHPCPTGSPQWKDEVVVSAMRACTAPGMGEELTYSSC